MNNCDKCGYATANPEFPDGLILCDDCRDEWDDDLDLASEQEKAMAYAEHMRDWFEDR